MLKTAKGTFPAYRGIVPFWRKGKYNPASRYFVWHVDGNTASVGNVHGLRNAHKASIMPKECVVNLRVFHAMKCRKAWRSLAGLEGKLWQE